MRVNPADQPACVAKILIPIACMVQILLSGCGAPDMATSSVDKASPKIEQEVSANSDLPPENEKAAASAMVVEDSVVEEWDDSQWVAEEFSIESHSETESEVTASAVVAPPSSELSIDSLPPPRFAAAPMHVAPPRHPGATQPVPPGSSAAFELMVEPPPAAGHDFTDPFANDFPGTDSSELPKQPQPVAAVQPQPGTPEQTQPKKRTRVEIFYATDRQHAPALIKGDVWEIFGWAIRMLGMALVVGTIGLIRQKMFWRIASVALLLASSVLGYGGLIEWQQRQRLADNDDVRYTHDIRLTTNAMVVPTIADTQPNPTTVIAAIQSLDYGICHVNIPPEHQTGIVDAPSITRFEFVEDLDKHVVLERVLRSDQDTFVANLNDRLGSGNGQALVFIHGYNVSFDDAVKRTAQISFDVKFKGTPICYSWPSHGGLEDYTRDMANADWSIVHLQEFLSLLFEQTEAKKIHVVAHSMGNRVLMQALDRLALQQSTDKKFGHIVLAAPDVSVNDFRHRYAKVIQKMAQQVTLYASSRDRALLVSAGVHGHNRAGLAGDGIVVIDGIDTIDVSHIDTSYIGHSYYGDNPDLIEDLKAIIGRSETTSERSWLERVDTAANRFYWKFR